MDVDPNYDPSDFLMSGLPMCKTEDDHKENVSMSDADGGIKIHDDLAVSESDDEGGNNMNTTDSQQEHEDDGGDLWF